MQNKVPHSPNDKPYARHRTENCLDALRRTYQDKVDLWRKLKAEGVSRKLRQQIVGISRATYYRYRQALIDFANGLLPPSKSRKNINKKQWGEAEKQLVLLVRRNNLTYGKEKIAVIINRDHYKKRKKYDPDRKISTSTVGRILTFLLEKGLIAKSRSAPRPKRKRQFQESHAQPWTYKKYGEMKLGERVQIDHMTVTKNGRAYKHFQAWDRRSKFIYAQVYYFANASHAKRFLLELVEIIPFEIMSIQVDGGSEFMADFETACKDLGIPLLVLPPARPTYNGGVERGNRIFKEEFYYRDDLLANTLAEMSAELGKALDKYNSFRPHKNLDGLTPMEYIKKALSEASKESQIA
jgi:transposase InsO family protein